MIRRWYKYPIIIGKSEVFLTSNLIILQNQKDMDFILSQYFLFQSKFQNSRISAETKSNSESFYLNLNTSNLKGVYELNQPEFKSAATYDYSFMPELEQLISFSTKLIQ
jgi:hypothetical protein